MSRVRWFAVLGLAGAMAFASTAHAQMRPYIGFAYPAGGQQGTTFQVKLGGQGLDDVDGVLVSGKGVTAKVLEYHRKLGPQDIQLLAEQLRDLRRANKGTPLASLTAPTSTSDAAAMASGGAMMDSGSGASASAHAHGKSETVPQLMARIESRIRAYVQRPACASISSLVFVEVTMAPDARPGQRELRLVTPRGVSNPLVFHVGQLPEVGRPPMGTAAFQVLGKEDLALRKRPDDEVEQRITLPCTVNGQTASGEVNWYRFQARKGQRLVISAQARQLIPYIADAVPGWFQPVLALYDDKGKELAYDDDYRFKPDPVILYEIPHDGEYRFSIIDAIYRGREDFVYRVSIGELPFVTSIFPLGNRAGAPPATIKMKGWNLQGAVLTPPPSDGRPGVYQIAAVKQAMVSNTVPFALDTLPEVYDQEPNNDIARAQKVKLPVIVNGRIDRPDDWDVFQFSGRGGETVVVEVYARRLDSPLDSVVKVTDASGNLLGMNDDHQDAGSGLNTHHADSYLSVKLPSDGTYFVHLGDTARAGGEEYAYRLRISAPRPDFALRVVPSSVSLRSRSGNALTIYALRKDGFNGSIKLNLKNPPAGISAYPVTLSPGQDTARLGLKAEWSATKVPVTLVVEGRAKIGERELAHEAVPAEDKMQAFLWRHLVPAADLKGLVFDPSYVPPSKRVPRKPSPSAEPKPATASTDPANKSKFTKQQVAGRLRQLLLLFEEGLLTDDFYNEKVAECETAM